MTNDISQHAKDVFAKNFLRYLNAAGKKQIDLVRDPGFSSGLVSEWATAKKYPRADKMQIIATYLGVQLSDLRYEKQPASDAGELSDDENEVIRLYKSLSAADRVFFKEALKKLQ